MSREREATLRFLRFSIVVAAMAGCEASAVTSDAAILALDAALDDTALPIDTPSDQGRRDGAASDRRSSEFIGFPDDVIDAPPGDSYMKEPPRSCLGPPIVDLATAEQSGPGEVSGWFDTRAEPLRRFRAPPSSCAAHRGRAAVFRYVPAADGPVLVTPRLDGSELAVEIFSDCDEGGALIGCVESATGWTPPLRAGRPVLIAVSPRAVVAPELAAIVAVRPIRFDWSAPVVGGIAIQRAEALPEDAPCGLLPTSRAVRCGPGLICQRGVCEPVRATECRVDEPRCDGLDVCDDGRCSEVIPAGRACHFLSRCEGALNCLHDRDGAERCVVGLPLGARCAPGELGIDPCAAELRCERGRCVGRHGLGEPCGASGTCSGGLLCSGERCARPEPALHGACSFYGARCPAGLGCWFGRCATAVGVGELCDSSNGPVCEDHLRCESGRCVAPTISRDACIPECPQHMRCDAGRCVRRGDPDQPCRATEPACFGTAVCVSGVCLDSGPCSARSAGARCGPGMSCIVAQASGLHRCERDGTLGARCRDGEAALAARECDSGLFCIDGYCQQGAGPSEGCNDRNCAPGLTCRARSGPARICASPGTPGAACRVTGGQRVCDAGLRCVRGECRWERLSDGQDCGGSQHETDGVEWTCAAGLSCVYGFCASQGTEETPCNAEAQCAQGFSCQYRPIDRRQYVLDWAWRCRPGPPSAAVTAGVAGSACRAAAPRCDAGLQCNTGRWPAYPQGFGGPISYQARCVSGVDADQVVYLERDVCALGLIPTLDARGDMRCRAVGAAGQQCRPTDLGCEDGLRCVQGVCGRAAGEGDVCDESEVGARRCDEGLDCVRGACTRIGTVGARCRVSVDACDAGLRCTQGRCVPELAIDAPCLNPRGACAPGVLCTPRGVGLYCLREGARDGFCRVDASPPCDASLRCVYGRCIP